MSLVNLPAPTRDEVETARGLFLETIRQLHPERNVVVESFNSIVAQFNRDPSIKFYGPAVLLWARGKLAEIEEHLRTAVVDGVGSIIEVTDHVLEHQTPIVSLFDKSIDWIEKGMTPTSEVYNRIAPGPGNRGLGLVEWHDSARNAYDAIVGEQQQATEAAKNLAKVMSRWLAEIGDENVSFVTFLLAQLSEIAQVLAAAAAAVVTSGGVFTLEKTADLVGKAIALAIERLAEVLRRLSAAVRRIIEAEGELADHSHFPDGQWPIAVART